MIAPAAIGDPGAAEAIAARGPQAWIEATERVADACRRLASAGPPSEVLSRAAGEAATALALDRVVVSRIEAGSLRAESVFLGSDEGAATDAAIAELRAARPSLEYPLFDAEVIRRRRPVIVTAEVASDEARRAFARELGWSEYLAVPVVLERQAIGLIQGDRLNAGAGPPDAGEARQASELGPLEREALWRFANGFAAAFERAVLRRRLRVQREQLRQVATWADARTSELSDAAIDLGTDREPLQGAEPVSARASGSKLRELLTRREIEVLEQMVEGGSNSQIARTLVISDSTVKFHVKNILRKLGVSNRAEATSRYMRISIQG